ncbi:MULTISPECIES: DNA primase [Thermus]|uniref:DNA primase n=1 Tax=Thermus brockianus TaxID=56956 RepID=UPI001F1A3920|nr:DNA primase [Thermus brockianus]
MDELREILNKLSPENWAEHKVALFDAMVLAGLDPVEAEAVLREAAQKVKVTLEAMRQAWRDFLGPTKREEAAARTIVDLVLEEVVELWHTPVGEAWATVPRDGHVEHYPVRGREFRAWLAGLYYAKEGKPLYAQAMQDVLAVLEAKALYEGQEHEVHTRLAGCGGKVYLDLSRPDWSVVEISPDGWHVIPAHEAPVRFRRRRYQKPLPLPKPGGSLSPFLDLLPLQERRDVVLVLGWLVGALSPRGPYPILILSGEKGAGKSTTARLLKALVDPQEAPLRAEPRNIEDLMVAAKGSWVVSYDNLSKVPEWLSDALCRLSTGGGLSKRELYTNDEEFVLEAQRPVVLTGIAFGAIRDDLADRSMLVHLTRVEEGERRPERELWEAFERIYPEALGALLDAVSMALRRREEVRTAMPSLPRLADWAIWVEAAAPALGLKAGEAVEVFYEVQAEFDQDLLDADPVARAILLLTVDWPEGYQATYTASELLAALERAVGIEEARIKPSGWPRTPAGLGRHLPRLQSALRGEGIRLQGERDRHTKNLRWRLEKVRKSTTATTATTADDVLDEIFLCGGLSSQPPQTTATTAEPPQGELPSGTGFAVDAVVAVDVYPLLSSGKGEEMEEGELL